MAEIGLTSTWATNVEHPEHLLEWLLQFVQVTIGYYELNSRAGLKSTGRF
jgi:hypothetical protein